MQLVPKLQQSEDFVMPQQQSQYVNNTISYPTQAAMPPAPSMMQPRLYKGPFNLQCCTTKQVHELHDCILKASSNSNIRVSQQPGNCIYHCNQNGVKFDLEIVELQSNRQRRGVTAKLHIVQFFNKSSQSTIPMNQMTPSQQ